MEISKFRAWLLPWGRARTVARMGSTREQAGACFGPPPGPRFHIGLNSGPALVGNIGSEEYRNFTAIGDTTNLASRLQDLAQPGQIAIGPTTAALIGDGVALTRLGSVTVKGRSGRVDAFSLDIGTAGGRSGP